MPTTDITDRKDRGAGERVREFARIERELAGRETDPKVMAMARARSQAGNGRLLRYLRIARSRAD